jgi:hypothetical protein
VIDLSKPKAPAQPTISLIIEDDGATLRVGPAGEPLVLRGSSRAQFLRHRGDAQATGPEADAFFLLGFLCAVSMFRRDWENRIHVKT